MRLAEATLHKDRVTEAVTARLDARLRANDARPVAVALSGGGDSVALLLIAKAWAERARRPLLVLTVDHRLQAESAAWTDTCRRHAEALGLAFEALVWAGPKPKAGLPAAARLARHRLLAQAAHRAGARVILMGHTADDVAEARIMRRTGSSTPEPRDWAPSPVWPEGRGVFILRPLLGVRRAELRDWLSARNETWIEDPANTDLRYARARARARASGPAAPDAAPPAEANALAALCEMDEAGVLSIPRDALGLAPRAEAHAFAATACLCAAGTDRPPAPERVRRLVDRLVSHAEVTASLAGARIEADADQVSFLREAGEAARGGLAPLWIEAGETAVWDGRFELTVDRRLEVRPLAGLMARLPDAARARLRGVPPKARTGLPVTVTGEGVRLVERRPLALERLRAACSLVVREP